MAGEGGVRILRRNELHFWAEEIVIRRERMFYPRNISGVIFIIGKFSELPCFSLIRIS